MRGKLLVIEGTEGSGKETQADLLVRRLNEMGEKAVKMRFPMYDTPTGKIIYEHILNKDGNSYFDEEVDPKALSLYYAADRVNNIGKINELLDKGVHVVLDRYVESNMAYQASKFEDVKDRVNMIFWMEQLEFNLLDLPRPDKVIFLFLPYQYRTLVGEVADSKYHNIEMTYHLLSRRYDFGVVSCVNDDKLKDINSISDEVLEYVKNIIK
mgnify:FL=1